MRNLLYLIGICEYFRGETPQLYTVLQEKKAGGVAASFMGSSHVYDMVREEKFSPAETELLFRSLNEEKKELWRRLCLFPPKFDVHKEVFRISNVVSYLSPFSRDFGFQSTFLGFLITLNQLLRYFRFYFFSFCSFFLP